MTTKNNEPSSPNTDLAVASTPVAAGQERAQTTAEATVGVLEDDDLNQVVGGAHVGASPSHIHLPPPKP
jgi:hypothetical protein